MAHHSPRAETYSMVFSGVQIDFTAARHANGQAKVTIIGGSPAVLRTIEADGALLAMLASNLGAASEQIRAAIAERLLGVAGG